MDGANAAVTLILGVIALVTAFASWVKWARPRLQERERDRIAQRDALIGRPPVFDSITRKEISPALPGIGQRMASVEVAIAQLAESNLRHHAHEQHLAKHDEQIAELQQARIERIVTRAESAAAWRAVEAVANPAVDEDQPDL